eukprot:scaffold189022_cov27-Tisochrysis_lutea.AAC.2
MARHGLRNLCFLFLFAADHNLPAKLRGAAVCTEMRVYPPTRTVLSAIHLCAPIQVPLCTDPSAMHLPPCYSVQLPAPSTQ